MNFKKAVATGAAVALLAAPVLNVSAAPAVPTGYVNTLKASGAESLILDVEAYKAAYPDLAAAFGDNTDAYLEHYLTTGIYEGRTAGALFNPLVYAEAYGDVKEAFGDDIAAIVNHYITLGVAENRTIGTAGGYADIAAAINDGASDISVPAESALAGAGENGTTAPGNEYAGVTANDGYENSSFADGNAGSSQAGNAGNSQAAAPTTDSAGNTGSSQAGNTGSTGNSTPASGTTGGSTNANRYHHTTSVYTNDESTLLRVEYYDDNNNLKEFSSVSNYDGNSNSYTEDVYSYNEETDTIVHERTDTYVNGELSSSEKH